MEAVVYTNFISTQVRLQLFTHFIIFILCLNSLHSYLHSCSPPIIHGNLTCDTIFIQHNGLVKIGSVAPDAIHHHVKTCRENMKNMHFIAPEYGCKWHATTSMDNEKIFHK